MKLLLLLLDDDESLGRGHPCTRPSVHDDFKLGGELAELFNTVVEVPAAADKR